MDPGFSDEEREERLERRQDRQVAVLENEIRHITNNLRQMQGSYQLLAEDRKLIADGLRTEIAQSASKLSEEIRRITTRLEALEQERLEIRYFKRRLSIYAAALAGIVAAIWQVAQVIAAWLAPLWRPP